jgi:hypothetical protein
MMLNAVHESIPVLVLDRVCGFTSMAVTTVMVVPRQMHQRTQQQN